LYDERGHERVGEEHDASEDNACAAQWHLHRMWMTSLFVDTRGHDGSGMTAGMLAGHLGGDVQKVGYSDERDTKRP